MPRCIDPRDVRGGWSDVEQAAKDRFSEKVEFENDAGPYGFDLTLQTAFVSPEPWTEYCDPATGHRWAGWLAARGIA